MLQRRPLVGGGPQGVGERGGVLTVRPVGSGIASITVTASSSTRCTAATAASNCPCRVAGILGIVRAYVARRLAVVAPAPTHPAAADSAGITVMVMATARTTRRERPRRACPDHLARRLPRVQPAATPARTHRRRPSRGRPPPAPPRPAPTPPGRPARRRPPP